MSKRRQTLRVVHVTKMSLLPASVFEKLGEIRTCRTRVGCRTKNKIQVIYLYLWVFWEGDTDSLHMLRLQNNELSSTAEALDDPFQSVQFIYDRFIEQRI